MTDKTETGPARPADTAPPCTCGHPRRNHSGRRDHREKHPNIPHRPWCHACETECIYCPPEVLEDEARDTVPAPGADRREQYAAAIRELNDGGGWMVDLDEDNDVTALADAVIAVADQEQQQLREELAAVRSDLAELTEARQHGAYTFCPQLVGHVNVTAFARKIAEKREAIGQRAEAVQYANEQMQRTERAEAELIEWKKLLQKSREKTAAHWAAIERVRQALHPLNKAFTDGRLHLSPAMQALWVRLEDALDQSAAPADTLDPQEKS
ncbi:hypothetical protein ACFQ6Q_00010 [Streptomyces sp. NPDC056437]|uniref:hypothetical protein n=1 Tax=Streptomyces sp. NPDC056437 TaxID=3345816 RepID=UPI0036890EA7